MNAKPLFILIFFGFSIALFAGGAMGNYDLTPDTPPAEDQSNYFSALAPVGQNAQAGQSGACASVYTVRSGDTLSEIARLCGLKLSDLIGANPQITNPDLIYIDQKINIPWSISPTQLLAETTVPTVQLEDAAAAVPEAGSVDATSPPVEQPVVVADSTDPIEEMDPIVAAFETARSPEGGSRAAISLPTPRPTNLETALGSGSLVEVTITGLPPNAAVSVGIGQVDKAPFYFDERITDDEGAITVAVTIPPSAELNQKWTVSIMTMDEPMVVVTAVPFLIQR